MLSNLIPRAWMNTKFVGTLAKCLRCVTLDRPGDFRKLGQGRLVAKGPIETATSFQGQEANFKAQICVNDMIIVVNSQGHSASAKVKEVGKNGLVLFKPFSPSHVALSAFSASSKNEKTVTAEYFFARKLNRRLLYDQVSNMMHSGHSTLIFPEGASHDGDMLLPFHGMLSS